MREKWTDKTVDERVKWYHGKLCELIDMIADKSLTNEERELCRYRLRQLKEKFALDRKVGGSVRRMKGKTDLEEQYYRIVMRASSHLPNLNTRPDNWMHELDDAREEIYHYFGSERGVKKVL